MDSGVLYAHKKEEDATGVVLGDAAKGCDVALSNLTGLIDMTMGKLLLLTYLLLKKGDLIKLTWN